MTNRPSSRLMVMLATLVMGGALLWIYGPGFSGEFIFDDHPAIIENESIRQLFPLWGTDNRGGPINPQQNTPLTARPLVNLSFAINYHFGTLDPFGYRATQVVLHWLAALLLWRLGYQVIRRSVLANRFEGGAKWITFAGALLWAIHPLNTETVNYVTQRTELMMTVFYFACLLACLRYLTASRPAARSLWLIAVLVTSWCGILCKETMATIPAVVLLGHWMLASPDADEASPSERLAGFLRRDLRSSWRVYAALASCWLPIAVIYQAGYVTPGGGFDNSIGAVQWWYTQCEVVFLYLRLSVWPWPLLVHYEFPIHQAFLDAWAFVVGCLVWITSALWLAWKRRWAGFVMLAFLIVLSPTLLIPLPGETVAERRMYLSLAVMTMWFAAAAFLLIERQVGAMQRYFVAFRPAFPLWACVVGIPLTSFLLVSHARIPAYRTQFSIWHDNMVHHPADHLSWMNVGAMLAESGQTEIGLPYLERAVQLNQDYERSRFNLARAYESLGRTAEAIEHYQAAIRLDREQYVSAYNLARIYDQQGNYDKAVELYKTVCAKRPDFLESHVNVGILLVSIPGASSEHLREAIEHFQAAVEIDASDDNYVNLMLAYRMAGQYAKARTAAKRGIEAALLEDDHQTAAALQNAIRHLPIGPLR